MKNPAGCQGRRGLSVPGSETVAGPILIHLARLGKIELKSSPGDD